jgi:uncharacterized protein (DUF433 family)
MIGDNAMTLLEQQPHTFVVPLREDPPGVLRVGKSRILLELVLRAYQRGKSPQEITRMYETLELGDVFAVIAYYLAQPTEFDAYLRQCGEEADTIRHNIEASQRSGPTKEELLSRAGTKEGLRL